MSSLHGFFHKLQNCQCQTINFMNEQVYYNKVHKQFTSLLLFVAHEYVWFASVHLNQPQPFSKTHCTIDMEKYIRECSLMVRSERP